MDAEALPEWSGAEVVEVSGGEVCVTRSDSLPVVCRVRGGSGVEGSIRVGDAVSMVNGCASVTMTHDAIQEAFACGCTAEFRRIVTLECARIIRILNVNTIRQTVKAQCFFTITWVPTRDEIEHDRLSSIPGIVLSEKVDTESERKACFLCDGRAVLKISCTATFLQDWKFCKFPWDEHNIVITIGLCSGVLIVNPEFRHTGVRWICVSVICWNSRSVEGTSIDGEMDRACFPNCVYCIFVLLTS